MRGEHALERAYSSTVCGSSPRARGTPSPRGPRARGFRFIPACAGNTPLESPQPLPTPVHPRVRGEHIPTAFISASLNGSSPRARGTPGVHRPPDLGRRFIPACAGEHPDPQPSNRQTLGSSPHARGTRRSGNRQMLARRFIPACAGNTRRSCSGWCCRPVHPRVRGEHGHGRRQEQREARFIPACAGNTSSATTGTCWRPVHPRVRGEHNVLVSRDRLCRLNTLGTGD